jgi:hypothetical protein
LVLQARPQPPPRKAGYSLTWLTHPEMTDKDHYVFVRPVVVYPGWYINRTNKGKGRDVWVLAPKGLPVYIENEPPQLSSSEISTIIYWLKRHLRQP